MTTNYASVATGGTEVSNLVVTAYDKAVEHVLRAQPLFRNFADKRPVDLTGPSATVRLQMYADLAPTTSALTEYVDPDPVQLGNTTYVDLTLSEWGTLGMSTRKIGLTALSDVDLELAGQIAWNMADSLDIQAQLAIAQNAGLIYFADHSASDAVTALSAGAGATYSGGTGLTSLAADDYITSNLVRQATTKLRANKVVPVKGSLYAHVISPEASADLRAETGAAAWRDPHNYSAAQQIWDGEIGAYEGQFFIESPRVFSNQLGAGSGGSQVRVFNSYVFGRQFLAEAVGEEPHVVVGPVTDGLMRFRRIGWYGFLGWKVYRSTAGVQLNMATRARPTT